MAEALANQTLSSQEHPAEIREAQSVTTQIPAMGPACALPTTFPTIPPVPTTETHVGTTSVWLGLAPTQQPPQEQPVEARRKRNVTTPTPAMGKAVAWSILSRPVQPVATPAPVTATGQTPVTEREHVCPTSNPRERRAAIRRILIAIIPTRATVAVLAWPTSPLQVFLAETKSEISVTIRTRVTEREPANPTLWPSVHHAETRAVPNVTTRIAVTGPAPVSRITFPMGRFVRMMEEIVQMTNAWRALAYISTGRCPLLVVIRATRIAPIRIRAMGMDRVWTITNSTVSSAATETH